MLIKKALKPLRHLKSWQWFVLLWFMSLGVAYTVLSILRFSLKLVM